MSSSQSSGAQPRRCIYCKSDLQKAGRAREHIVPQWIQREWGLAQVELQPTRYDEKLNPIQARKHVHDKFLAGNVCAPCNSGWMSRLENESKEIILPLAAGKRRIASLEETEATLLSRWTLKTAYALHSSANWRRVVPESHVFTLDAPKPVLPERVFVIGHTYQQGRAFGWQQSTTWQGVYDAYKPTPRDRRDG